MITALTDPLSPLAQVRQDRRLDVVGSAAQFSDADQATLRHLLSERIDYVQSKSFSRSDAVRKIFDEAPPIKRPDSSWYHPVMDSGSSRLSNPNGSVLLTAAQERVLFLQFNYCRFAMERLRRKIAAAGEVDATLGRELLNWHVKAEAYRDQIAQTNLALVLAMAKRTRVSEVDFSDLVSEGNMALLRAIDKFDVARGFKFSTYACRAILKAFSRIGVKLTKYRQLFPTDFDPKLEKSDFMQKKREGHEDDCVDELRQIIKENRAELSDIEQEVIEHRFALGRRLEQHPDAQPLTLEQVGKIIGVTKERVRQIQNKALEKIRTTLENDYLF